MNKIIRVTTCLLSVVGTVIPSMHARGITSDEDSRYIQRYCDEVYGSGYYDSDEERRRAIQDCVAEQSRYYSQDSNAQDPGSYSQDSNTSTEGGQQTE